MSWQMIVYPPLGQMMKASYSDTSPGGIVGTFRWKRTPVGGCGGLQFKGQATQLNIGPRDVIALFVDGVGQHWGPVVQMPAPGDARVQDFVVGGERDIMEKAFNTDLGEFNNMDLSDIANYLYTTSTIYGTSNMVPHTVSSGRILSTFKAPLVPLDRVMDALVQSGSGIDLGWGVTPGGQFFFKAISSSITVPYSDGAFRYLPMDLRDVVLKVYLVRIVQKGLLTYFPYADPDYPTYGTAKAFNFPWDIGKKDSLTPTTKTSLGGVNTRVGSIADLMDGNNATYDEHYYAGSTGIGLTVVSQIGIMIGFDGLQYVDHVVVRASIVQSGQQTTLIDYPLYWATDTGAGGEFANSGGAVDVDETLTIKGFITAMSLYFFQANSIDAYHLKIEEVHFYGDLNNAVYTDIAKSLIVKPTQKPSEIVLPYLVNPALTATISGVPGGDVTGRPAEYEYEHGPEGTKTIIRFGMDNPDQQSRAIRFIAKKLLEAGQVTNQQAVRLATS